MPPASCHLLLTTRKSLFQIKLKKTKHARLPFPTVPSPGYSGETSREPPTHALCHTASYAGEVLRGAHLDQLLAFPEAPLSVSSYCCLRTWAAGTASAPPPPPRLTHAKASEGAWLYKLRCNDISSLMNRGLFLKGKEFDLPF